MMAVGDDQLLVAHSVLHCGDHRRIGNLPDPVRDSIFVRNIDDGRFLRSQQGIDLPGIFVEQKKLLVVGPGGAQQVEPVGLGLRQGLLVTVDDFGGIILHAAQGDESAALEAGSGRGREGLGVGVNGGRGILSENALGSPIAAMGGRPGIDVVAGALGLAAPEDDPNQVVGAGVVVAILHGGSNFVVRLGHDLRRGNLLQVVAETAKGMNVCHF